MNRRTFLQGAALLGLSGLACNTRDKEHTAADGEKAGPPVVLIVFDTVRADHCSAWGHPRKTTPVLDAFLQGATRHARAVAPAPWTLPSHASLFTGEYPFEHGAHTRLRDTDDGGVTVFELPLDDEAFTLAEALKKLGYATGAFNANTVFLGERYNVLQGFDTNVSDRLRAGPLTRAGLEWAEEHKDDAFFLFFNIMDAHRPYNLDPLPGAGGWEVPQDPDLLDELYFQAMPADRPVSPELVDQVARQYDQGILHADAALGRILAWLQENGLYDEAIVIVASDHGEFLGEHHLVEHSKDIFQPTAWVPLAVKLPGQREARVEQAWTSLCAVPAMVLGALGEETAERFPQLTKGAAEGRPVICENYYSRKWDFEHEVWGRRFRRRRTALYEGDYKLIHSSDGDHGLYNLVEDPREKNSLVEKDLDRFSRMHAALADFKPLDVPAETATGAALAEELPPFTPEELEQMRALGYLGIGE